MKYQSYLLIELITHSLMRNTFCFDTYGGCSNLCFWISLYLFRMTFLFRPMICLSSFFVIYVNGIMADSARSTASHGEFIQPPGRGPATSHCRLGWLGSKIQLKQQHSGGCFNETHEIYGNVYVSFCESP